MFSVETKHQGYTPYTQSSNDQLNDGGEILMVDISTFQQQQEKNNDFR